MDTAVRAVNAPGFEATTVNRNWLCACNTSLDMGTGTTKLSELLPTGTKLNSESNSEIKYNIE